MGSHRMFSQPADVLAVLCGLLSSEPDEPFATRTQRLTRGSTIFIGAMNDVHVGGGRQELPRRLDDLLTRVHLKALPPREVGAIAYSICGATFARAEDVPNPQLLSLALELNARLPEDVPGIDARFNLRTLQNLAGIFEAVDWAALDPDIHLEYQQHSNSRAIHVDYPPRPQRESDTGSELRTVPRISSRYVQLAALMLIYTSSCSPRFTCAAERSVAWRLVACRRRQRAKHPGDDETALLALWRTRKVPVEVRRGVLSFGPVVGSRASGLAGGACWALPRLPMRDDYWGDSAAAPQRGARHQRQLELLSLASESRRIVMLEGPTCSGKTSAVRDLAWLRNARLLTVPINAETEVTDLVGGFAPTGDGPGEESLTLLNAALGVAMRAGATGAIVQKMLSHLPARGVNASDEADSVLAAVILECAEAQLTAAGAPPPQRPADGSAAAGVASDGRAADADGACVRSELEVLLRAGRALRHARGAKLPFRIYEGPLVVAMKRGYWLLLDNVNAASPEVIERINSLGEADASLHLFELGEGKVAPHPAFRCFVTAATRRGSAYSLSDAFRNRTITVQCEPLDAGLRARPSAREDAAAARAEAYEALELLAQGCGCSSRLARELVKLHEMALGHVASTPRKVCGYELSVRNLHKAALMAGRGVPIETVMRQAYDTMAPMLTQDLWERQLFGNFFKGEANAKTFGDADDNDAPAAQDGGDGGDGGAADDEVEGESGPEGGNLRKSANGSVEREDDAALEGEYADSDTGVEDGRQREEAGEEEAGEEDDATDGGSDVGGDEQVAEEASQAGAAGGEPEQLRAAPGSVAGGAGAFRPADGAHGPTVNGVNEIVKAGEQRAEYEAAPQGEAGEAAEVSLEDVDGDCAQVSEAGGVEAAGGPDTAGGAASAPRGQQTALDASGGAPPVDDGGRRTLLGRMEAALSGTSSAPSAGLSAALLKLAEALVGRLELQVLSPALESTDFCQLEALAAELRHGRQQHALKVRDLRRRAEGDVRERQLQGERQMATAQAMERAATRQFGSPEPPAQLVDVGSRAMMDATLEQTASARYEVRRRSALDEELHKAEAAHASWAELGVAEFEGAIDVFESNTVEALEKVARGTSLGVDLHLNEALALRTAAVDICTDRLSVQLDELRMKQLAPGAHDHLRDVDGIDPASSEQRPPRKDKARDDDKGRGNGTEYAEDPSDATEADAAGRPGDSALSAEAAGRSEDVSAPQVEATPEAVEATLSPSPTDLAANPATGGVDMQWMSSPQLHEASARLRESLHVQRSAKPAVSASDSAAPTCRIVVDASVIGSNEGMLPPLLLLLVRSLELSNVPVEVALSGPQELLLPCVAKAADDSSPRAVAEAMHRVLLAADGTAFPTPEAAPRPPSFVLSVSPPATEKGVPLPLRTSTAAACAELHGSRLGFVLIDSKGSVELGSWAATEDASGTMRSYVRLEEMLAAMLPPRVLPPPPADEPWHAVWRRWSTFELSTEAAEAAIHGLAQGLRLATHGAPGASRSGLDALMGADDRAAAAAAMPQEATAELAEEIIAPSELRAELQERQEMRAGSCLLEESDQLWQDLESMEAVQLLTEELVSALCSMPPNVYTQCSVGAQGKVLSIPALVKRYILGNSVTAIWKRQDRGGKRKLAVCLALDLTPSHAADANLTCVVLSLLAALHRMQYSVHVVAYTLAGVWVVHSGEAWESGSKARLLLLLAAAAGASQTVPPAEAAGCHARQAVLLGLQLLLCAPLAATSPKMLWLITGGAVHCAPSGLAGACALARSKNVEVVALGVRGDASLRLMGCPRWLATSSSSGVPLMIAAVLSDDQPPSPPGETPPSNAIAAVRAAAAATSSTLPQVKRKGTGDAAPLSRRKDDSPPPVCHTYLSGALDYTTVAAQPKAEESPWPPQPSDAFEFEDEIQAFYKKVRSSSQQVRTAMKLTWSKRGIDAHDGRRMARIFAMELREPSPWNLRQLSLEKNALGDVGLQTLAYAMSTGALSRLTRLTLTSNGIGNDGLIGLAVALRSGALPQLEWLFLNANQIGDAGLDALATTLAESGSSADGVLTKLQQLWLHENSIGDEGVAALMRVLARQGAMPALTSLSLDHNRIRRPGAISIVEAIQQGALPKIKSILLNDNQAGSRAQQDVADAIQARAGARS